jgi:hypothetical protein
VTAIAAGNDSSVAVKSDGSVVAWSDTGDTSGTTDASLKNVPVSATGSFAAAAGEYFDLAIVAQTAPGAPTGVVASPANSAASVSWNAPSSDGKSPITGYTVTSSPGAKTCTTTGALSCNIVGLTNGTVYTFTVTAANAVGTGPASTPSAAVTPFAAAPPVAASTPTRTPAATASPGASAAKNPKATKKPAKSRAPGATDEPAESPGASVEPGVAGPTDQGGSSNTPLLVALIVVVGIAVVLAAALAWTLWQRRNRVASAGSPGDPPSSDGSPGGEASASPEPSSGQSGGTDSQPLG